MLALCLAMVEPEEQEAFTAFFDRHYKPVLYKACKILKNRENAEDVTQEIFLYAADHFEKFHGRKDAEIRRYLMECTESRAVDMLRRRNGAPEKADEGEVARAATDDTEQIVLRQDTMTRLLRCIGMTKGQVYRMFVYEGAVFGVLASLLGTMGCLVMLPKFQENWLHTQMPLVLVLSCLVCIALAVCTIFLCFCLIFLVLDLRGRKPGELFSS